MTGPYKLGKPWEVRKTVLNFKHVFSLEYLYKRLHEWLVEEGYCEDNSDDRSDKWIEKLYLERGLPGGAKQIWIFWRTDRSHASKFFKFYLNLDFHILGLMPQEIVVSGTKVKTNKGECEVTITAMMELDPAGEWNENFVLRNSYLQNFFLNRIYKTRIKEAEDELIRDANRLLGAVKQYYQLESWLPEYTGEPFHPAKGR